MAEEKQGISLDEKYKHTKALTKTGALKYFDRRVDQLRRGGMLRGDAEGQVLREARAALKVKEGQPVYYYDLGWSVGYVAGPVEGACIRIQPIGAYKAKTPSTVFVPVEDVRLIDPKLLRKPWGTLKALS